MTKSYPVDLVLFQKRHFFTYIFISNFRSTEKLIPFRLRKAGKCFGESARNSASIFVKENGRALQCKRGKVTVQTLGDPWTEVQV